MIRRLSLSLAILASLSACATTSIPTSARNMETVTLNKAKSCAIGYDLSQHVYRHVDIAGTVIRLSPRLGECGKHAAHYLRRAGYAVDETATSHDVGLFSIQTFADSETDMLIARARLPEVTLTRSYRLADTGVYATSAVYATREVAQ